jgi:HD-like signal output (HDOD) protein
MATRRVPPLAGPAPTTRDQLASLALAALASGAVRVPAYPTVVSRLQAMVARERSGVHDIASIVAADPVLAALVLARASSAAGGVGPITSIDAAVMRLGGTELVQLALTSSLGRATAGPGVLAALRRSGWRDALLAAGLCEAVAHHRYLEPDQAYLAGLLHDMGAIVGVAALEAVAAAHPLAPRPDDDWRAIVDRIHVPAGVEVARAWKLAPELVEVIAEHHTPAAVISANPLVRLVAAIDSVVAAFAAPHTAESDEAVTAALRGVSGLEPGEDQLIRAALPHVVELIAGFELAMPSPAASVATPTLVAPAAPPADPGWPVAFSVTARRTTYAAHAVWYDRFAFHGAAALQPDWLAQLVIDDGVDRLDVLANIKSCEAAGGGFELVAAPYGLAGDVARRWRAVVERARAAR